MSARTADNREIGRVLANFGAADLRAVIPDPHIRAGLAVLVGTLAEGAIATIRSKNPFESVQFAKLPNGVESESVPGDTPGLRSILISEKHRHEDPRLFAALLAHETLHQDGFDSDTEEAVNDYMLSIVYGQKSLEDPSLPRTFTELTQRLNIFLLALINDRDALGNLRVEICNCTNIFPGSRPPTPPTFAALDDAQPYDWAMLSSTAC